MPIDKTIRYQPEPPDEWAEAIKRLRAYGDCADVEDRVAWRAAQLAQQGVRAEIVVKDDGSLALRLPDGTIEDFPF